MLASQFVCLKLTVDGHGSRDAVPQFYHGYININSTLRQSLSFGLSIRSVSLLPDQPAYIYDIPYTIQEAEGATLTVSRACGDLQSDTSPLSMARIL